MKWFQLLLAVAVMSLNAGLYAQEDPSVVEEPVAVEEFAAPEEIPAVEVPAEEPLAEEPVAEEPFAEAPEDFPVIEEPELPTVILPTPTELEVTKDPTELREVAVEASGKNITVSYFGKEITFVQPMNLEFVVKSDDGGIGIRFRDPNREILAICMNTVPNTPYYGQALLGATHHSYSGIEEVPKNSDQEKLILTLVEGWLKEHPEETDSKHRNITAMKEFVTLLRK